MIRTVMIVVTISVLISLSMSFTTESITITDDGTTTPVPNLDGSSWDGDAMQYCPEFQLDRIGMRYVPEADVWIEWHSTPTSWHYQGRERGMFAEEKEIYELEQRIEYETNAEKKDDLRLMLRDLRILYKSILEDIERKDEIRHRERVKTLLRNRK